MAEYDLPSSDSEDEEYVPEEVLSSCSDVSEGEAEESSGHALRRERGGEKPEGISGKKRGKRKPTTSRKRRKEGGVQLDDKTKQERCEDNRSKEGKRKEEEEEEQIRRVRVDDLWASFKHDTGFKDRTVPSKSSSSLQPKTVTIRKTYDFAGEEVVVNKEVAVDSKEAKLFLCSQTTHQVGEKEPRGEEERSPAVTTIPPTSYPSMCKTPPMDSGALSKPSMDARAVAVSTKRSVGLSSVLQSIDKKPKMSVLEKSRVDWLHYKKEEGIEEELERNTKDGYLEKQDFLHRADLRQFELEREERLKRFKRFK